MLSYYRRLIEYSQNIIVTYENLLYFESSNKTGLQSIFFKYFALMLRYYFFF